MCLHHTLLVTDEVADEQEGVGKKKLQLQNANAK